MNNWCICWLFMHPLNGELNPICHLLALLGGATIVVVSRLRVNINTTGWTRSKLIYMGLNNRCTYFLAVYYFYSAAPTCFDAYVLSLGSSSVPAMLHANPKQRMKRLCILRGYV